MPTERFSLQVDVDTRKAGRSLAGLQSQTVGATSAFSRMDAKVRSMNTTFAGLAGLTALAAGLRSATRAAIEQAQVEAQLEQAVRSTGGAAGWTAAQLKQQASAFQSVTKFGDEAIIKMQSVLLTFTKIAGDTFPRTEQAVLDLATRMGTDLQAAAVQLGKALNDPVANLGELGRAGIQFTKAQKSVIKSLWEGGRAAEAQALILDELETQFGGSAKAAAKAAGGGWEQMKNAIGDLSEKLGGELVPALDGTGRAVKKWAEQVIKYWDAVASAINTSIAQIMRVMAAWAKASTMFTVTGLLGIDTGAQKLIDTLELLAEGLEIKAAQALDKYESVADEVSNTQAALSTSTDAVTDSFESSKQAVDRLKRGLALLNNELEATREYWESGAWEPFAADKIIPSPEFLLDWDEFASIFGDMIEDTMKSRVQKGWEAAMPYVKGQLTNAMLDGAQVLADSIMGADVDFEQTFMDIGKRMGGNIGEGIGYYLGGPAGAMLGRFIGSIIGETAGKFLGKIFGSIFGGSGVAAVARLGNIATPGSGGVPGAGNETPGIENVGSGSGGLDSGGVGLGALASNFQQFTDNLAQLEALIGESISLTESLSIKLMDEGQVFVTLANGMRHEFATAAEAFDFALGYLLKTAELSGQVAPAVEEILRSGMAFEDMVNALNLLAGLDTQLLNMGDSVDRAKAALQGALQPFADLKAQINAMGLSAEASAPLLAKVAKAEARRNKELKVGLLGQLAAWARELGKNIGLQRKVAVLEAKIKFKELKVQLKMLGMWEKYGALARELKNLAIEAARAVGDATKSFGGGGAQGVADEIGDAVRDAIGDAGGDTYGRVAGTGTAPEDVMASAFAQIGSKAEFKSPFEQLKALYKEQLRYFQGINWGDPEREAAAFEMLTQEFQAAFGRLVAEIQDSLGAFKDTLAEKFGRGTPLEEAADSQTAFNELLAAALAGDLDALAAIQDAADAALQDAADAFGTSTTAFDDIFSMVMDGLKQLETATIDAPDPTTAINEQTTAVVTSLDVVRTTIQREAEADRAVLLDIRDAISASAVAV